MSTDPSLLPPLFAPPSPWPEEFLGWLKDRREVIARDGYALRAGQGARGHTIEVKSLTPHDHLAADDPLRVNEWCVMSLPEGGREFAHATDRDAVHSALQNTKV